MSNYSSDIETRSWNLLGTRVRFRLKEQNRGDREGFRGTEVRQGIELSEAKPKLPFSLNLS
jgi:hypothetical protein